MDELTLKFSWGSGKGQMIVCIPEFLRMHSVRKYRKLLKLIQKSDTPDAVQKIAEYIHQELSSNGQYMLEKDKKFYEKLSQW